MAVGNKCALFQSILQLLYGFLLLGHVTSIKCNKFLMSTSVQESEVTECTTQGLEYCFTFVLKNDDGEIIHEELGCLPKEVPHFQLDLYCDGRSSSCCSEDYCNEKVVPLPSPVPSPSTSTPVPSGTTTFSFTMSGYLLAGIAVAGVTAVLLAVMSIVGAVYFYRWKRHYSRLLATAGGVNGTTASCKSSGSSTGSVSTPTYHI